MAQDVIFARLEGAKENSLSQVESLTFGLEDSITVWRRNQDKIFALVSKYVQNLNWYIARVMSSWLTPRKLSKKYKHDGCPRRTKLSPRKVGHIT
jgi:hypothetical protein